MRRAVVGREHRPRHLHLLRQDRHDHRGPAAARAPRSRARHVDERAARRSPRSPRARESGDPLDAAILRAPPRAAGARDGVEALATFPFTEDSPARDRGRARTPTAAVCAATKGAPEMVLGDVPTSTPPSARRGRARIGELAARGPQGDRLRLAPARRAVRPATSPERGYRVRRPAGLRGSGARRASPTPIGAAARPASTSSW